MFGVVSHRRRTNAAIIMKHVVLFSSLLLAHVLQGQWQNLGSGVANTPRKIFSISAVDENILWAVAYDPSGAAAYDFTVTQDGGIVWNAGILPSQGNYYPGQIHAVDGQTAWALLINTPQQDRVKILRTTDGGSTWQDLPGEFNTPGYGLACLHFFNANEGIAFGSPGTGDPLVDSLRIYRTSDGGTNWSRISAASLPAPATDEGQWVYGDNRYEAKGDTLWFCTRAGRVFRTTDQGLTWQAFNTGLIGSLNFPGLASVAFENNLRGIVTSYAPSQAARTQDGGETWTLLSIPASLPAGDIEHIPGTASTYFVNEGYLNPSNATSPYLITHDSGDTWQSVTFTPALPVIKFLSPTVGFGGGNITSPTQGGIYKWVGGGVGINEAADDAAQLLVFPNPNEGNFTVLVDPRSSLVRIDVMDAVGRTVITQQQAANTGRINVQAEGLLVPGLYIVRSDDGQHTTEERLIVQ